MKSVNVHYAKTNFSRLLAALEESGEPITICRNGRPVADLGPHQRQERTKPHPIMSKIQINYDPVEPAADDEWPRGSR